MGTKKQILGKLKIEENIDSSVSIVLYLMYRVAGGWNLSQSMRQGSPWTGVSIRYRELSDTHTLIRTN